MRIDINLASQPYEDAQHFWMRWGTALVAVGAVTLGLLAMTGVGLVSAHHDHKTMAAERAVIAQCDQKRAEAEKILNLPENRTTRDESQVLNQLIERKAFSWTLVLENLEKVMPTRVHLIGINPELDEDNQLALKMTVGGDSRDRAIELERRMEESHRFARTEITGERRAESTNGDTEQIEIAALYVPPQNTGPEAQKVTEKPAEAKAEAKANAKASGKTATPSAAPQHASPQSRTQNGLRRTPKTLAPKGSQQ
jgi:type IV pilus assembly protein PilN